MKKLLFVHIPKTGGVTINDTLIKQGYVNLYGHQFAKTIKGKIPTTFDGLIKFSTVRDPWSRLLSTYTFLTKGSNIHRPPEHKEFNRLGSTSFDDFIRKIYTSNKGEDDVYMFRNHPTSIVNLYTRLETNWIFDDKGNQLVDYICKLDNLSEDMETFNKKYGYQIDILPPQNLTVHKHYSEMYTEETKNMVTELYAKDIETFGFE